MTKREVDKFIEICRVPFDGYTDNGKTKKEYARLGRKVARRLAEAIDQSGANVRWNKAGPAVAGDVTMHGNRIAVYFTGGPMFTGEHAQFLYRRVEGKHDHTGGGNRWLPYTSLEGLADNPGACKAVLTLRGALMGPG